MKIYLVGGSVRDKLLNISPRDTDYLVTEATEEDLLKRGLVKVGQTFPIFLNPETGDEYTLGKTPEEDLSRRDLTINAMAIDEAGKLIDLYGGERDLQNKVLRHVSAANFFEDPLRVMRAARFLSQLPDFNLHPATLKLLTDVTATADYKKILSERIIKELKRVFQCKRPSRFFETLKSINGLDPYFSELKVSFSGFDQLKGDEEIFFSYLVSGLSLSELETLSQRLSLQTNWVEAARAWILFSQLPNESAEDILEFFYQTDVFRKPRLLEHVAALDKLRGARLQKLFTEIKEIGISDVSSTLKGKEISAEIKRLRLIKLRATLSL